MAKVSLEIVGKDSGAKSIVDNVTGSIVKAQVAFEAIKIVTKSVIDITKKSIEAYAQQELALVKLKSQIGNNTGEYEKYASAIQEVTTVGDEEVIQLLSTAKAMGIQNSELTKASNTAIGLAKLYGMDLNTSMKMVALAGEGNVSMLSRYVPELRNATTYTQQMAIIQQKAAAGMKYAKDEANTFTGSLKQLSNLQGDVLENFGGIAAVLLQELTPGLKEIFKGVNNVLASFLALDKDTQKLTFAVTGIGIAIAALVLTFPAIITGIKAITAAMAANPFGLIVVVITTLLIPAIILLIKNFDTIKLVAQKVFAGVAKNVQEFGLSVKIVFMEFVKKIIDGIQLLYFPVITVFNTIIKGVNAVMKTSIPTITGLLNTVTGAIDKEIEKTKEAKTAIEERYKTEAALLDEQIKNKKKAKKDDDKHIADQVAGARVVSEAEKKAAEAARLAWIETQQKKFEYASKYISATTAVVDQFFTNELAGAEGNAEKTKEIKQKQFVANKAIKIAETIMATAQSVMEAMKLGWPAGSILAGVTAGMGAIQVGLIAAQPMPAFAEGGIVPGNSTTGDKVLARLNSGEMVLNKDQQKILANRSGSTQYNFYGNIVANNPVELARGMKRLARLEGARP